MKTRMTMRSLSNHLFIHSALIALTVVLLLDQQVAWGRKGDEPYGIVSIRVTYQLYDAVQPWNKNVEQSIRGNAVVVDGKRLLTTADMVKSANLLEVRKFGRYPDYPARVVLVDYELNLALLAVDDPKFWEGLRPLSLADKFESPGFNINRWRSNGRFEQGKGETVEIRVASSPFGSMEFPVLLGSTAMTGLGWSEVLTEDGALIGLLTGHSEQQVQSTDVSVIKNFIRASRSDPYEGFAHRGFTWQQMNHPHMRNLYKLQKVETGILIKGLFPGGTGAKELKVGDILHKIGSYNVDPEGKINHPVFGLVRFTMAFNETLEKTLPLVIQRGDKTLKLDLLRRRFSGEDYRVSPPFFDRQPDFEVIGGLVFQELSVNYLKAWGKGWDTKAPTRLVLEYSMNALRKKEEPFSKVLVITKVLPDPSNIGYNNASNAMISKVNGKPVISLEALRKALGKPQGKYHIIEIMPGQGRGKLVYDARGLEKINKRIAKRYGIPAR